DEPATAVANTTDTAADAEPSRWPAAPGRRRGPRPGRSRAAGARGWRSRHPLLLRRLVRHPLEPDDPLRDRWMAGEDVTQEPLPRRQPAGARVHDAEVGGSPGDRVGRLVGGLELLQRP